MIAVYNFLDNDGSVIGCGTQAEFDHWTREGTFDGHHIGNRLCWEHPREDEKRRKMWEAERN